MNNSNKLTILIINIIIIVFIIYINAYIYLNKPIDKYLGIMSVFIVVCIIYSQILISRSKEKDTDVDDVSRGMVNRRRDNPIYDIIGGIAGFN